MKRYPKRKKRIIYSIISAFLITYIGTMVYHTYKPLPKNISFESDTYQVEDVRFYHNLTYPKGDTIKHELVIFDRINEMIAEADDFIVLDLFLFNQYHEPNKSFPTVSEDLTEAIIKKKTEDPDIKVVFITDRINTGYGSYPSKLLENLENHGVEVVYTNLNRLRDPTPLYSGVWRMFIQWFGTEGDGWITNSFASTAPDMTARSYLKLLNVKANHRKVVVTDKSAMISSANPHDASGYHGNIAFEVTGPIIKEILEAEQAVADISEAGVTLPAFKKKEGEGTGPYFIQFITEGKIQEHVVEAIEQADEGDDIRIGMFYIADRSVVTALVEAANRGVNVKLVLDPNENAFGHQKTGLPNRPVAMEMVEDTKGKIDIRWYNTTIEQYHTKMMMVKGKDDTTIIGGSANFTKRNLEPFNLEADLEIRTDSGSELVTEIDAYFERIWNNEDGTYTLDYEKYESKLSYFQRAVYAVQKFLRLTTY